jgi:hypothetical protein
VPQGGVYEAAVDDLLSADGKMSVKSAVDPKAVPGGLRPHGIAFDDEKREISFVNRGFQKINGRWTMTPAIVRAGLDGDPYLEESPAPCSANDVAATADGSAVTFDHAACGWRAMIEDVRGGKHAGVAGNNGDALFRGAAYANGIERLKDGEIALAATRENAVLLLARAASGLSIEKRFSLPGAPDNLSIADDGALVAAVHPSLLRLALARKLGVGKAPSRIVKVDENGSVQILFEDPKGAAMSAATIGVETRGALIVGSVLARGLLVCKADA